MPGKGSSQAERSQAPRRLTQAAQGKVYQGL
jgi:hypothetical protein